MGSPTLEIMGFRERMMRSMGEIGRARIGILVVVSFRDRDTVV